MRKCTIFIITIFPIISYGIVSDYNPDSRGSDFIASINVSHLFSEQEMIFLFRIILASLIGAIIGIAHGYKRETIKIGVKTYCAVCLGSATFSSIYAHLYLVTGLGNTMENLGSITTGIGFLCAGVIFKEGLTVQGLTTATSIWATAAIGTVFKSYTKPLILSPRI